MIEFYEKIRKFYIIFLDYHLFQGFKRLWQGSDKKCSIRNNIRKYSPNIVRYIQVLIKKIFFVFWVF